MMRKAHTITVSVFCREHEDEHRIKEGLLFLLGMDEATLKKEGCVFHRVRAKGFEERGIIILSATLDKARHITRFLARLCSLLSPAQRRIVLMEAKSRLDDDFFFYLRFDKPTLILEKKLQLIDGGNCYHIKMSIAAFPKRRDVALDVVKSLFSEDLNTDRGE